MRCKVVCNAKIPAEADGGIYLYFSPVYTGSVENETFFKFTPGGTIYLNVVRPETAAQFEVGKEYYMDFNPVDAA